MQIIHGSFTQESYFRDCDSVSVKPKYQIWYQIQYR